MFARIRLTLKAHRLLGQKSLVSAHLFNERRLCTSRGSKESSSVDWQCTHTWRKASINTSWCLLGCSIGEFGTIAAFQAYYGMAVTPTLFTVVAPVVNGLITSVALETIILHKGSAQMPLRVAFQTATGMSFISMCMMEFAMELSGKCIK